jgi:hypothetical protein
MNRDRHTTFTQIGDVLARQAMPELQRAARLPLRVTCIGLASYDSCEEAGSVDRTVVIGEGPTPEDAMRVASERVSRGDIRIGTDKALRFSPRFAVILDREHGLVLAGAIRAGIILWEQPVSCDAEARRVVTDASRLRGRAFAAADRGEHVSAREFRYCAGLLEARLVDSVWRETAAALLRLPQAA